MPITFSPGCGNNTWVNYPAPVAGWDSCYLNLVVTEMTCVMTIDNVYAPCKCDASGTCKSDTTSGTSSTPGLDTLLCNGQPIAFPPTGSPDISISGSCTYTKAGSIAATTSTTASTTTSTTTSVSGGITLTKSNMLIAASLVLCTFIGSF